MSDKTIVVKWKGGEIKTYSEMWEEASKISDPQEAEAFIQAYEKAGMKREIFLSNLGYWAGYYGEADRRRVHKVFGAVHPIFGTNFNPTPEEAFKKGQEMGEKVRKGKR